MNDLKPLHVYDKVHFKAREQVYDQVNYQVNYQVQVQVGRQVCDQIISQIPIRTINLIRGQVNNTDNEIQWVI